MKNYYECHITMAMPNNADDLADWIPIIERYKWKFSCIEGDPDLGAGRKCYATMQYHKKLTLNGVIQKVNTEADRIRSYGIPVLREKVELVVYDKRSKIL